MADISCRRCNRVLQFDGEVRAALPFAECAVCHDECAELRASLAAMTKKLTDAYASDNNAKAAAQAELRAEQSDSRARRLAEALAKAQELYKAANFSLENTDEDPEAERGMEMPQVYTLSHAWAKLCDAVDDIDVDGPGFEDILSDPTVSRWLEKDKALAKIADTRKRYEQALAEAKAKRDMRVYELQEVAYLAQLRDDFAKLDAAEGKP